MRAQFVLFLGLVAAALASSQARKLDLSHPSKDLIVPFHPERVHFVDRVGQNALFRGNEPIVNGSAELSYETVVNEIKKKALDEANWVIPEPFYIVDLSFEFIERKDINAEKSFFNANPSLGTYLEWPLFGVPFPPSSVGSSLQNYLAGGPIWLADKLPERMEELREKLETDADGDAGTPPVIIYAHCEAGCDRTGEFIASYLMQYKNFTMAEAWESDVVSCGREPVTLSMWAMEWYCEYLKLHGAPQIDSCAINR